MRKILIVGLLILVAVSPTALADFLANPTTVNIASCVGGSSATMKVAQVDESIWYGHIGCSNTDRDLYRSLDNGATWTKLRDAGANNVVFYADSEKLYFIETLTLYRSVDGGTNWLAGVVMTPPDASCDNVFALGIDGSNVHVAFKVDSPTSGDCDAAAGVQCVGRISSADGGATFGAAAGYATRDELAEVPRCFSTSDIYPVQNSAGRIVALGHTLHTTSGTKHQLRAYVSNDYGASWVMVNAGSVFSTTGSAAIYDFSSAAVWRNTNTVVSCYQYIPDGDTASAEDTTMVAIYSTNGGFNWFSVAVTSESSDFDDTECNVLPVEENYLVFLTESSRNYFQIVATDLSFDVLEEMAMPVNEARPGLSVAPNGKVAYFGNSGANIFVVITDFTAPISGDPNEGDNILGQTVAFVADSWGMSVATVSWVIGVIVVGLFLWRFRAASPLMIAVMAFLAIGLSVTMGLFPMWLLFVLIFLIIAVAGTILFASKKDEAESD